MLTEEDILERQKKALGAGFSLFFKSYQSHTIEDSESEDDDPSDRYNLLLTL